jgi:hypothetical protein
LLANLCIEITTFLSELQRNSCAAVRFAIAAKAAAKRQILICRFQLLLFSQAREMQDMRVHRVALYQAQ